MAWNFDPADYDYVYVDDNAALSLPDGPWTLGGWWRHSSPTSNQRHVLCGWRNSGTNTVRILATGANLAGYAGKFVCRIYDAAGYTPGLLITGNTYADDAWHHILLQRDADGYLNCYIDGVKDPASGLKFEAWGAVDAAEPWNFGRDANGVNYADGGMAEWAKWNRALSSAERSGLAAGKSPAFYAADLAWYVKMLAGDYSEEIVPLTVTNNGTSAAAHPAISYPGGMPPALLSSGHYLGA